MSTKIEWAQESWNPITGCTKISEGCQNCYAERMAKRLAGRYGYLEAPNQFTPQFHPERLRQLSKWKKPRRIFVVSMGDMFHEDIPYWMIDDCFEAMIQSPQHTYMILTKRPQNLYKWADSTGNRRELIENTKAWLGVTAENQQRANERIPILLQIPAAVRFVSVEPMLGPVELFAKYIDINNPKWVDWVICGAETGPGKRIMRKAWADDLRHLCKYSDVPFFFKKDSDGSRLLDGREWNEMPDDLIRGAKVVG